MKLAIVLCAMTVTAEPVAEFYTMYRGLKFEGLPNKAQLASLAPYLSADMQSAIKNAQSVQAKCMKKFPTDKPMWIEGDMFSSNFEGFTKFKVVDSNAAKATVAFEYVENGHKVAWSDDVIFRTEKGKVVIDDFRFGRTQGFTSGYGESLKKSLRGTNCE